MRKSRHRARLPDPVVWRQPFPGPGLAIRIMGEVTEEKLQTLRDADYILREEIAKAGLSREIWQYFATMTSTYTVGVMGDARTYEPVIAIRAVTSVDAMTADWARIRTTSWRRFRAASSTRSNTPTASSTTSRPNPPPPSSGNKGEAICGLFPIFRGKRFAFCRKYGILSLK